ncbi:MAG: putative ABC transporter ATP-binding protein YbiT [Chlamydiia bacterium]|nr:putative ABC transporter ATP-binding protein YbiT [Chlamydiia bacterium]
MKKLVQVAAIIADCMGAQLPGRLEVGQKLWDYFVKGVQFKSLLCYDPYSMITLSLISMKMGARTLFEEVTVAFNSGCRYALTGPNGAGKSTLLKIIMKQMEPTSGTCSIPERIGYLRQDIDMFKEFKVRDVVIKGNERLASALEERDALYEKIDLSDEEGMRLGDLEAIIMDEDGYSADTEAEKLLAGIGIPEEEFDKLFGEIQTSHQFRVLLCQALFGNPEALLLDEPTNHLDLESIRWLEEFLHDYTGTLVVISHDRHFLNAVATHCADIDYDTIILYPGNYDGMLEAKTKYRQQAEQEIASKQKKIAQLNAFVQKFGAGTRASQVQSRRKEIDRLTPQELKRSNIQRPFIVFETEKPPGHQVFKCHGLSKSYDDLSVLKDMTFEVSRGDKVGVIGNNGVGKTTLLKVLAGELERTRGSFQTGHNVSIGLFPQNHEEVVDKSKPYTIMEWLQMRSKTNFDQDIRDALGKLLFSGDDAFKKVATLSGGETARLILADLMLAKHNVLLLDEPNNHLDLESVSALASAIDRFDGTVVVASHDRDLLNNGCNRIISLTSDSHRVFEGTLDDLLCRPVQA